MAKKEEGRKVGEMVLPYQVKCIWCKGEITVDVPTLKGEVWLCEDCSIRERASKSYGWCTDVVNSEDNQ